MPLRFKIILYNRKAAKLINAKKQFALVDVFDNL